MIVYSKRIVTSEKEMAGYLIIEDGKIKEIRNDSEPMTADIDAGNLRIIPGIIDTHNHGCYGYRMNENITESQLKGYLKGNASLGVTTVFPTFAYLTDYKGYHVVVDAMNHFQDGAQIGGIHSEGPFGARVGEKGINNGYPAVDMEICHKMVEAGQGKLKLVAIAPEVDGAIEAIKYFVSQGVTVAAYHTNANYEQANAGIDAGITVMTHLGNVMTGLHHRDVGTLGAGLLRDEAYCEIICDGMHVSLPMVKIMMKVKNHDHIMMISDNVQYAGLPQGPYKCMNETDQGTDRAVVTMTPEGFVLSKTGRISGSSKPVLYGIGNLVEKLGMDIVDVCHMSSMNAAFKYNLTGKGCLKPGYDADFVIINDDYTVNQTYCLGKKVYDCTDQNDLVNKDYINTYKI